MNAGLKHLEEWAVINYLRACTVPPELDRELKKWAVSENTEMRIAAISALGRGRRLPAQKWVKKTLIRALGAQNPAGVRAEAQRVLSQIMPDKYCSS